MKLCLLNRSSKGRLCLKLFNWPFIQFNRMKKYLISSLYCLWMVCAKPCASQNVTPPNDQKNTGDSLVNGDNFWLPSIFESGMVLQQRTKTLFWGSAAPGKNIRIIPSWNQKLYTTAANAKGNWEVRIPTPAAGGPYEVLLQSDEEQRKLQDVLIGEVWVCSGQSNMEMPLKGYRNQPVLHADSLIADADRHPDIRIFRVAKVVSPMPQRDCKGKWFKNNSKNAPDFSAIAYQYALILNQKLHVPVGVIATYWGGTAIQSWMSKENLKKIPGAWLTDRPDTIKDPEKDPEKSPFILYNSMIAPIAGYTIKGFVWYQGESNRYHPLFYKTLMPAMVKEWRDLWREGNIPFYFVQIAPYQYNWKNDYFSAILRESQLNAMDVIPNSGMAVSIDAGAEHFIHPPDKTVIAQRLSYWALAKTYHEKNVDYASPILKKMKIQKGMAILSFKNAKHGLISTRDGLLNFQVAGSDHKFYPAKAFIRGKNKVVVQSEKVKNPIAVRYAFKNWVRGDLYNKEELPASSFRTDDFK